MCSSVRFRFFLQNINLNFFLSPLGLLNLLVLKPVTVEVVGIISRSPRSDEVVILTAWI